jgi:hypothetical protein
VKWRIKQWINRSGSLTTSWDVVSEVGDTIVVDLSFEECEKIATEHNKVVDFLEKPANI